jgi:hypothetical protein
VISKSDPLCGSTINDERVISHTRERAVRAPAATHLTERISYADGDGEKGEPEPPEKGDDTASACVRGARPATSGRSGRTGVHGDRARALLALRASSASRAACLSFDLAACRDR